MVTSQLGRHDISKEQVGAFLARKRRDRGISTYKLAEAIGAPSGPYITVLEKGRIDVRNGKKGYFEKIVRALGITDDELRDEFGVSFVAGSVGLDVPIGRDDVARAALAAGMVPVPVYNAPSTMTGQSDTVCVIDAARGEILTHVVGLRVRDTRMAPYLDPGDIAVIDARPGNLPQPGDRVAVRPSGGAAFVTIYIGAAPDAFLHRSEDSTAQIEFAPSDTEVVGKVIRRIKRT